jgi:hypothetical protein
VIQRAGPNAAAVSSMSSGAETASAAVALAELSAFIG